MKLVIYELWNSNMVGHEWRWDVSLEPVKDGSYTLSAEQTLIEGDETDIPLELSPITGLRRGADIYNAFLDLLDRISENPKNVDLEAVADKLRLHDITLANHFTRGEELLHKRWLREKRRGRIKSDSNLAKYEDVIEAYIAGLDDAPGTVGAQQISSPKERVRTYLKSLLERHEQLPPRDVAIGLALGPEENKGPTTVDAPDGWIKVPYRRTSKSNYRAGICPFCGNEYRAKPFVPRWSIECSCGAKLDYLGMAWLRDEPFVHD